MGGLKQSHTVADVRSRRNAKPADQTSAQIRKNISVEVRHNHHIIEFGLLHQLHAHIVHQSFLIDYVFASAFDLACQHRISLSRFKIGPFELGAVGLGDFSGHAVEQAVGELHYVGFGDCGDTLAVAGDSLLERQFDYSPSARDRDGLDRDGGIRPDLAVAHRDDLRGLIAAHVPFHSGIEVFRVLTDNHQIDVCVAAADAWIVFTGTHARIKVKLLAQCNVHASEPAADWGGDRTFQRDLVASDAVEHFCRKRCPVLFHHVHSSIADFPFDIDACGLNYPSGSFGDLGPGTVARDECNQCRQIGYLRSVHG